MADPHNKSDKKLVISTGRYGEKKTFDLNKEQRPRESFKATKKRLIDEHRNRVRGAAADEGLIDAAILAHESVPRLSPKAQAAKHQRDLRQHAKKKFLRKLLSGKGPLTDKERADMEELETKHTATLKTKPRRK